MDMSLFACAALGFVMAEFWYVVRCSAGVLAICSAALRVDVAICAWYNTPSASHKQSLVDRCHGPFDCKYQRDENYDGYYGSVNYDD